MSSGRSGGTKRVKIVRSGLGAGDPGDRRQDPLHPGQVPVGALGEQGLHVDAEMRGPGPSGP